MKIQERYPKFFSQRKQKKHWEPVTWRGGVGESLGRIFINETNKSIPYHEQTQEF